MEYRLAMQLPFGSRMTPPSRSQTAFLPLTPYGDHLLSMLDGVLHRCLTHDTTVLLELCSFFAVLMTQR